MRKSIQQLSPAYFGMVMATGIVSVAAHQLGMPLFAAALLPLNIATYVVLCLLNVLRVIWYTREFFSDMVDHRHGPGFFTFAAAPCILGSQFILIAGNYHVAIVLWGVGLLLWVG